MQRLTEDFLDNIDDRSEIGTEEVQIQDEDSKSPEDYPYVLRFSISNLYFKQKNLLSMIRRAMETVWIKSSSVIVDVEKQNRHEVSVGFEHDFRSIRDIFKFLSICSQAFPVVGDVLYILDTGHNNHKQTGSRSIMIGNMSIYMNFNKKGMLMIPTKTASTYEYSVNQNFEIAAMLLKDEYKIRAAKYIEECYSCNVFQRMITYVLSRLMYDYRKKVMLMGRYIPKALKGHTIDISKLVSSKTIEFVYCKNGQWKYSYKKTLDSDIFMEVIRQKGSVLTINDFKFIMGSYINMRFLVSVGHFLYADKETPIKYDREVSQIMTGMICINASSSEAMLTWIQLHIGKDVVSEEEWKRIINNNAWNY